MNYEYENKIITAKLGSCICGIDEAGRGPLAGPMVAAAAILDPENLDLFEAVKDSKLLSDKKRRELFPVILANVKSWALGVVTQTEIDKHGLSYANKLAMKKAWYFLSIKPDYIVSDYMPNLSFNTRFELIKQGDKKVLSIAVASVIAKVFRDNMMLAFAKRYPKYGFEQHKGYGTKYHMEMIEKHGPCDIHRMSFEPLKPKLF